MYHIINTKEVNINWKIYIYDENFIKQIWDEIEITEEESIYFVFDWEKKIFIKNKTEIQKNINLIKQKYRDEIFARYSLTDQLNISNEAVQITALTQFEKRDFTEEETLKLLDIQEAKKWIDEKRKECQDEIIALN